MFITGSVALHGLKSSLSSPIGKLPCTVPSSSIAAANLEVSKLLPIGMTEHPTQSASLPTQKGTYAKFTPKQRTTIGNYAILHGTSAALQHSKK